MVWKPSEKEEEYFARMEFDYEERRRPPRQSFQWPDDIPFPKRSLR